MPRIADILEDESRTVDLEQGDFERLLGRRERKQRNRRIRAGSVGVIVALAVGIALVRSLTSDPIPVDPPVVPRPAPAASGTLTYILDGDIFLADPDGSNAVKIANGLPDNECDRGIVGEQYWAEGTMWSPDGRYLAYRHTECSDPEFRGGVEISDAEGNAITTFPTGAGWDIAWSPDSTRVAVWDAFGETIGVYGVDGARQTKLTMPSGWTPSGDHDPVWMPDGTSLMVEDIELPLDGAPPRQLPLPAGAWSITYSPDGSHVAYVDHRSLIVARSNGSEPREMFGDWTGDPTWSPTGDRIAFSDGESLRLLDVATGEVRRLTEEERGTDLRVMGFSPEGDRVLFSTIESDSLWSIGVDGSDASVVVPGTWQGEWLSTTPPDARPVPAASGTLAYALDGDIFVADPDGSNAVKIANGLSDGDCGDKTAGESYWAEGAMWSPDGRYLAYRYSDCSSKEYPRGVVISDAESNVLATFPTGTGWDIGWSPDSTRVAVWDSLDETVGVYGVDGVRQAQITMPSEWVPVGDHDPAWLQDGTLAVDAVELPLDGGAARPLDKARAAEWREDYLVTIGQGSFSPDGSQTVYGKGRSLMLEGSDGSGSVTMLTVEPGASPSVIGFSPEGDRILFSKDGDGQGGGQRRELWSVGVDGFGARLVVAGTIQGEWFVPSVASDDIPADSPVEPGPAPGASGRLAYVLDGDIYVADQDGSNAVKIADGRPEEECAGIGEYWAEGTMWSPDGRYLAYRYSDCSDPEHVGRDVVISDAGGNVLATFPAQGWDIAWSPDSTRVAVWDRFYDPPSTIGVYGLDGARQTQLTMPSGWTPSGDRDPVWMPDGTSLVVENVEVPIDGSTPRQLPQEDPRSDPDATISPDGTRVAYDDHGSLVVAAVDGSDAREVVRPWVGDPVWSPTGDRIAFIYSQKNPGGSNELRVLDVATGEVTPLYGMGGSVEVWNIQFSAEGDRILFTVSDDRGAGESSLWSINADGTDARRLVAGTIQGDWLSR